MSGNAQEFDQLVNDYYHAWFRYHPEAAVDAGFEEFAGLLKPHGDDDIGAQVVLNEKLLSALEDFNPDELDEDRALDFRVLRGAATLELHELLERDWRRRDPAAFLPVNAIFQLTIRPISQFFESVKSRLSEIPASLRSAKTELLIDPEQIPALWLKSAIEESLSGSVFLKSLHKHPKIHQDVAHAGEIQQLADEAAHALDDFARFLESELSDKANGSHACGQAHFERLLKHRHFLDLTAEELYSFGKKLFEETRELLLAECEKISGERDIEALTKKIQCDYPSSEQLLQSYREQMLRAHDFLVEHELVSLPATQKLKVVETPAFLRHEIPFAAYVEPTPNDQEQNGYYYVTPADDPELLCEHNHLGIMNTSVHEAWPGHHLQFVTANQKAESRTLPRLMNPSATLYEGWALYCEQLMHEQGFLDQEAHGFILLRDRLWRALRIMLDVDLQVNGVSPDQAAQRLSDELGFPLAQAKAEILWYTRAPTVPMGYATGWALITGLRGLQEAQDMESRLKAFHDQLLASGSIGLPLVIQRKFGKQAWEQVSKEVFAT